MADEVRKNRAPAAPDNPFTALQESASLQIVAALDAWRDMRDAMSESLFLTLYGSPLVQAVLGIDPADTRRQRLSGTNPLYNELANAQIAEIRAKIGKGGVREAVVRALIYIAMPRAAIDERAFQAIRRLRTRHLDGKGSAMPELTALSLAEFKTLVREQSFMLVFDQKAAVAAIPDLLPENLITRRKVFELLRELLEAPTEITGEVANRLKEAAVWFGVDPKRRLSRRSSLFRLSLRPRSVIAPTGGHAAPLETSSRKAIKYGHDPYFYGHRVFGIGLWKPRPSYVQLDGRAAQAPRSPHCETHSERQKLYRKFIEEASRLYADALAKDKSEISQLVGVYALIGRMRLMSNEDVIAAAEKAVLLIVETYLSPNRALVDLPGLLKEMDPLRDFAEACRRELLEAQQR